MPDRQSLLLTACFVPNPHSQCSKEWEPGPSKTSVTQVAGQPSAWLCAGPLAA